MPFFTQLKIILQGWWNVFLDFISDIKYKKYFDERYKICSECEKNKCGICKECGCIIIAKTKSEDSSCPLKKWLTIKDTLATDK